MKDKKLILGAIAGDIIGSAYEFNPIKTTDFELFVNKPNDSNEDDAKHRRFQTNSCVTDDSIMTIATMDNILLGEEYKETYPRWGRSYPFASYGETFADWIMQRDPQPYNSWGNGSAMRVSPVGYSEKTLDDVLKEAKRSAECSHNHPEGIKGAQSTAVAVFLALNGKSKKDIKDYLELQFDYQFDTLDTIRPFYRFDISCQGTCPPAFQAFFESNDFEHAIRLAVSLGGDADTLGAITGSVAEAFYGGIPEHIYNKVLTYLSKHQLKVLQEFSNKYNRE